MPRPDEWGDVGNLGADCYWKPTVRVLSGGKLVAGPTYFAPPLLSADAFVTTASRDAYLTEEFSPGLVPMVLVGPNWVVEAVATYSDESQYTPAQLHAVLAALAQRIGGTIRTAK